MQEVELLGKFKNKLFEEYGYEEQDIKIEVKLDKLTRENIRYIPDIVVYKDQKPYIIIELKHNYSQRIFEQAFEKVSQATRSVGAKYCAIATLDFIEAYELKNDEFFMISNIPNSIGDFDPKNRLDIDEINYKYLFNEVKDILWSGGKRDSYTIINEFNKILLVKFFLDDMFLNNTSSYAETFKYGSMPDINNLFLAANANLKIFEDLDKINLNQKEIEKIINILEAIGLLDGIFNIDKIYYDVFTKDLKNGEVFLSEDAVKFLSKILDETQMTLLTNSGFGQLSVALSAQLINFDFIEPNSIKYRTNLILQLIKRTHSKHQLDEFLDENTFEYDTFEQIVSTPPLNVRTKEYKSYQLSKYTSGTDMSALYIEKSLDLLHKNGLLFVAISDSILSNQMFSYVRDFIKHSCQIIAILSFENGIFLNTKIPSSLLILKKQKIHDYHVLVKNINVKNIDEEIKLIKTFIKHQQSIENTLHIDALNDRWDYHYYKKEFLEIENKISNIVHTFLADYVETIRGGSLGKNQIGTINLITVGTIQNGKLDKNKLSFITDEQNEKNSRSIVRENDLVVSVVGRYPKCAKVTAEFADSNTNSGIVILRMKDGLQNKIDEIYEYLNTNLGQLLLHRGVSFTSTVPILTQKELEKIPLIERYDYDEILEFIDQVQELPLFKNQQDDNISYNEDIEPENVILSLNGIKGKVFGLDVVRCFISLKDLVNFEINNQNFQREIDDIHKNELVEFLNKSDFKFFPEIVLAIRDIDTLIEQKVVSLINMEQCIQLRFHDTEDLQKNIYQNIEILDGRHRVKSLKDYIEKDNSHENLTVSIIFILLSDSDTKNLVQRAIFYNLNAKAKPLLPKDYLNLLENDPNNILQELKITNIDLFKHLSLNKYRMFNMRENNEDILEKCIDITYKLSFHFQSNDLEKLDFLINLFEMQHNSILKKYDIHLKTKFYILSIHVISEIRLNRTNIRDYLNKELAGFIEWLKLSNLFESLQKINELKDFYKTYQKTYVPKSRNIYISMPYHKETEWTYFLIKDVINDISNNLQIKIKPIRTDQQTNGVHTGISETVYNDIESCDLMIADLTGGNANVFNEVGFKMGLDKAQALKETQIIFIVNSKCYYEEHLENESFIDNEYKVNGKVLKNNSKPVPFNLRGIKHIEFYNSHYLKVELYKELEKYFSYYKITKVSK